MRSETALVISGITILLLGTVAITVYPRLDAPLEQPANPHMTADPGEAPWYTLSPSEVTVYVDPWIYSVVWPVLSILGVALGATLIMMGVYKYTKVKRQVSNDGSV